MSISKIAILMSYNQYESKRYFAHQLAVSLREFGIAVELIDPVDGVMTPADAQKIEGFAPDFTMSFNSTVANSSGLFCWDYWRIPHLEVLVDPAFHILGRPPSPYLFYSSVDREDCKWLQSNGIPKIFFWPHAVDAVPPQKEQVERLYDVVFLGTCTDYKGLEKRWQNKLNKEEQTILLGAIERMWRSPLASLPQALVESVRNSGIDPSGINFRNVFFYLDQYVRGKDRVELIRSIEHAQVHVFGESAWVNPDSKVSWKDYLGDRPNVVIHDPVTYRESFLIMQQAKICLNSSPFFKHGSHERILNALACDAVPLTTHNGYIEEFFIPGEDLLSYRPGQWKEVDARIADLLANESLREEMAAKGKAKVLEYHTWPVRAQELLQLVPQYLNPIII